MMRASTPGAPQGFDEALDAIRKRDGEALARVAIERPMLFESLPNDSLRIGPVWEIIKQFLYERDVETVALLRSLRSAGVDVSAHLNGELLGGPFFATSVDQVAALLELGADPSWIPPSGRSVLDYALVRYWNGEAAGLIAQRVQPRSAFWVAAALGDVEGVNAHCDAHGTLRNSAKTDRPDARALGVREPLARDLNPHATDREIISEAMFYAGLNGRANSVRALLDLGAQVDYAPGTLSLLYLTIAQEDDRTELVELLIERGADAHLRVRPTSNETPMVLAQRLLEFDDYPHASRVLDLLSAREI
jgi:hypothetical protein